MSRNLRNKKSAWIVIDETGSEGGDDLQIEDKDSDYEFEQRSDEVKATKKDDDEVSVVDVDEVNRKASIRRKDKESSSKNTATEKRRKNEERSLNTEVTSSSKNEIIIDVEDEDVEPGKSVSSKTRKRKEPSKTDAVKKMRTAGESSARKELDIDKSEDNRSAVKAEGNVLKTDPKKEKRSSERNAALSLRREIIIDDESEEDIKPEKRVMVRNRKKKESPETVVAGNMKAVEESSIKKKVDIDKTAENRSAIETESNRLKTDLKREKRSSRTDVKLFSQDAIVIDDDDDDDEDIKPGTRIPVKSDKRKASDERVAAKRMKTSEASSSKEKLVEFKEEGSSDSDATLLSKQEIIINNDDDEDMKPETSVPVEITKREASDKRLGAKRMKTSQASSSREKFVDIKEEEEGSSDTDAKLLSKDEILIDDEDIKPEIKKESNKTADVKKVKKEGNSLKEKEFEIDETDANPSAVKPENKKPSKNKKSNSDAERDGEWSEVDYLLEYNQVEPEIAKNLVSLFKNDNTIPFIARYRKEMTGGMEPEQLRSVKNICDDFKRIKNRGLIILKCLRSAHRWSPEIHAAVTAAKSLDELELIYAPFKLGPKGTLAERARQLGLAEICEAILQGQAVPRLSSLIDSSREGLKKESDVRKGIMHIIAEVISKDKITFEGIRSLRKTAVINIETTQSRSASKAVNNVANTRTKVERKQSLDNSHQKYEMYFYFVSSERAIKDYQILAINRGEAQKILSVKIVIPDWFQSRLKDLCLRKYNFIRKVSDFHSSILEEGFNDAYKRLIEPLIIRRVRHELNERAENSSIEVFARNLKKLLLMPPLRGKTILGVDPGFNHGCKLAVISHCGNVLDTATIYPHTSAKSNREQGVRVLANLVKKHRCTIVALGNATACRETEKFLTDLMQTGVFAPLNLAYTIVNEAGASIYSCSAEAKSEFPDLDPNIISAISIARRLQDPLAELIKVEPKHLGIGMYQHDLPKKRLQLALDEVLSETVSFVGVDINTASHCLLTKVAGLNAQRATNIIELRNKCGLFSNRKQLRDVKGIGNKFFEQCAGFIRVLPETALTGTGSPPKKYPLDYLDQTWIHPESYDVARRFIKACNCDITQIGTENFVQKVSSYANGRSKMLAKEFGTSETSMDIIINGLSMKKGEDIRVEEEAPLFQKNLRCMDDLSVNTKLTGLVRNVTNFGAFVDIGVGTNGLIYLGNMKGKVLSLGQRVEVIVLSVDKDRGRISLSL